MQRQAIDILLVEDNEADALLVREAFKGSNLSVNIRTAEDGEEAMNYLLDSTGKSKGLLPDLILLDLNLPVKDGRTVLEEVKAMPDLKRIPVLVLSTSRAERDLSDCYDRHANGYITKPAGFREMLDVIKSIEDFWFSIATLPPKPSLN